MSILVTCAQCSAKDRVAGEHAGKAILCKACHAPMVVPSSGDVGEAGVKTTANGGARRTRNWGDEEEKKAAIAKPKARGSRSVAVVAVVLVLSCVLCTGVGGIAAWWAFPDMQQLQPRPGMNVKREVFVNEVPGQGPMKAVVGNQNARIRYTATQTGDYVIAATVFSNLRPEGASFTLTVRAE
jgi:hypothetical protein